MGDAAGDAAGEPVGLAAGDAVGLDVAAGLGVVGLISGVEPHAPKNTAEAAQTVSRTLLLNIVVFILFSLPKHCFGCGFSHAVLSRQADFPLKPVPADCPARAGKTAGLLLVRK